MMQNFNDTIKNLQNFNLEPSTQVWQEIENSLDEKQKKRIVLWWWSLPIIGLFMAGVWMYVLNKNVPKQSNSQYLTPTKKASSMMNVPQKNEQVTKSVGLSTDDKIHQSTANHSVTVGNSIAYNYTDFNKKFNSHKNASNAIRKVVSAERQTLVQHQKTESKSINDDIGTSLNESIVKSSETYSETVAKVEGVVNAAPITAIPNSIDKKDTNSLKKEIVDANPIKKTNIIKSHQKKLNFNLAFAGGVNYISRNDVLGNNANTNYLYGTTSSPTSSVQPSNMQSALPLHHTGFKFSIGVGANYNLSKKWTLQSGLKYAYLQNSIEVASGISNALFSSTDPIVSGNRTSLKNHFHLLEIPLNIQYCIALNSKNKLSLLGGASADVSLSNNWLFADNSKGIYTNENDNINKAFIALQTGVSVNFNNKFSVDILVKKYLTTVQKSSSKYYWQQLNLQVNIPISHKQ